MRFVYGKVDIKTIKRNRLYVNECLEKGKQ